MRKFSIITENKYQDYEVKLYYYKRTKEDKQYKTWIFNNDEFERNYGWEKLPPPSYLDTSDEAKQWYRDTNIEDLYFINKELDSCKEWYESIKDDINLAKKHGY